MNSSLFLSSVLAHIIGDFYLQTDKDTDTAKTEYVLAGTFLSFGIAILCGLLARI